MQICVAACATPQITRHIMPKSRKEAEAEVRSWGFKHVFTWTDGP